MKKNLMLALVLSFTVISFSGFAQADDGCTKRTGLSATNAGDTIASGEQNLIEPCPPATTDRELAARKAVRANGTAQ